MAERERDEVFGALREVDALLGGRLTLTDKGSIAFHGRTAHKYEIGLGEAQTTPENEKGQVLPTLLETKRGRDATTLRRLAFFESREPKSVRGELVVDGETAAVLKAKVDARLVTPKKEGAAEASLRLTLDATLSEIGRETQVRPPKDFLPDQDKPQGIEDALERFGLGRKAAQAAKEQEQDDEG
jgi:hypothetical protein